MCTIFQSSCLDFVKKKRETSEFILFSFMHLLFTTRNKVQNHCKSKKNQILSNNKVLFGYK